MLLKATFLVNAKHWQQLLSAHSTVMFIERIRNKFFSCIPTYATAMLQTTWLPQPFGYVRDSKADVRRRAARVQLCRILPGGTCLGGVCGRPVTATVPHVSGLISWHCPSRGHGVSRCPVLRARARHGLPRAHVVHRANCHFRRASIPDNRNFIIFSFHRLLSAEGTTRFVCVFRVFCVYIYMYVSFINLSRLHACDSIQRLGKM